MFILHHEQCNMKLLIEKGQIYGNLTVIEEAERYRLPSGQTNRAFLCLCNCGNEKIIRLAHLVRGRITSCGCLIPKHGMCYTSLYGSWRAMKDRVFLKSHINHNRYIDRGIKLYPEWNKFLPFRQWALANGWKEGLTLDRRDNNGNYEPSNCRFILPIDNCNNREITKMVLYNGIKVSLSALLHQKNIHDHYAAINSRISRGWDEQGAIDTPIRVGNYRRRERR